MDFKWFRKLYPRTLNYKGEINQVMLWPDFYMLLCRLGVVEERYFELIRLVVYRVQISRWIYVLYCSEVTRRRS